MLVKISDFISLK